MGSNSDFKNIISATPSTIRKPGRVDLVKVDFDTVVNEKGYRVYIDRAVKCPCRKKDDNQALSSCKNCGGSGYVFVNRYETRLVIQSMNVNTKFKGWSEELLGTATITARSEELLGFMDRVTLQEGVHIRSQSLHPEMNNGVNTVRLEYSPLEIFEAFIFVTSDQKLRRLKGGTDYTVDRNIITLSSEFNTFQDIGMAMRYSYRPTYNIIDFPRGTMETEVLDRKSGRNSYVQMPISAVGRISHYNKDEQNLSNTFILDNSREVNCTDSDSYKVPSNDTCPIIRND